MEQQSRAAAAAKSQSPAAPDDIALIIFAHASLNTTHALAAKTSPPPERPGSET